MHLNHLSLGFQGDDAVFIGIVRHIVVFYGRPFDRSRHVIIFLFDPLSFDEEQRPVFRLLVLVVGRFPQPVGIVTCLRFHVRQVP